MTVRLRMICADVARELAFDRTSISIGHGPFNDVVFADCSIAPVHGELEVHDGGDLAFRARASALPTRVFRDGQCTQSSDGVEEQTLHVRPGDVIYLGEAPSVKLEIIEMHQQAAASWRTQKMLEQASLTMSATSARLLYRIMETLSAAPTIESLLRAVAWVCQDTTSQIPGQIQLAIPIELAPWRSDDHLLGEIVIAEESLPNDGLSRLQGVYRHTRDPLPVFGAQTSQILEELGTLESFVWLGPQQAGDAPAALIPCALNQKLAAVLDCRFPRSQSEPDGEALAEFAAQIQPLAAIVVGHAMGQRRCESLAEENRHWRQRQRRHHLYKDLIAESDASREVYEQLNACVEHDEPVLMLGEAGSGKALVARAMHHLSARKNAMLTSINCRSLSGDELDFELFGSVANELTGDIEARKGIFELAKGGTVFLEEIDQLSLLLQGKLLRMLREGEVRRIGEAAGRRVDVRVIVSTHADLPALIGSGRFRRDLYLVLSEHRLHLPPLRERREDILPLARTFLRNFCDRYDRTCRRISPKVEDMLLAHRWQGNVRELQSVMESAVLQCNQSVIEPCHLRL